MNELDASYSGIAPRDIPVASDGTPDFRIRRLEGSDWEIRILSSSGQTFVIQTHALQHAEDQGTTFRTDLAGVNGFVREARERGYRAEYVGPNEVIQF